MNKLTHIEPPNCPCDLRIHPPELDIPAGLSRLPRQIATFPEFRNAMLAAIQTKYPLRSWEARKEDDFGLMLLEMWAYICDSLSFYDQIIAQETYVRTAQERAALSKLVQLLGYIPRPAVASTALLAAIAEGRRPVSLPKGMAFRSGAFDTEPPQVFESTDETIVHPFTNQWDVLAPQYPWVDTEQPKSLHLAPERAIEEGMIVLLLHQQSLASSQGKQIKNVEATVGQPSYTKVTFNTATKLKKKTPLSQLRLYVPTQRTGLWTIVQESKGKVQNPSVLTKGQSTVLRLNKLYDNFKPEQYILVSREEEFRVFKITKVGQVMRQPNPTSTAKINGFTYNIPSISVPVTELQLDASINSKERKGKGKGSIDWGDEHRSSLLVHYDMELAGTVVNLPKKQLSSKDPIRLKQPIEPVLNENDIRSFFLQDVNQESQMIHGRLQQKDNRLVSNQGQYWTPSLQLPVTAYGNVVAVSRGETVPHEYLGTGDASQTNQRFELQKKPLTYLLAPSTERGILNTLKVYVDGIQWQEVPSFFGTTDQDQVYIVRQDEEEKSYITFGDGNRGQRLVTGSQVTATYRFGAGVASPPLGSINQIATPVEGLQSIHNPLAASGGADAESKEHLRENAPASALVLGRAVSILDMKAVALSLPGVRRVQAEWRWDLQKQRPVVALWYIGENELEALISERLRSLCDPNTPIKVYQATAIPINLAVSIQIDSRYIPQQVIDAIRTHLFDQKNGILRPEKQQIGFPVYRSQLFEALLSVPGVVAVLSLFWSQKPFKAFAKRPKAGHYFDFEKGILSITHHDIDPL